ncbi:MAG: hypothetical protein O9302_11650 [Cyclobacteriaceae bacterium]|jgi:hypothetical protein|nr:hypothetical protein [Flammeovirgaceae bacterium]MCZ8022050.1 hypothetical protein [Cytophagales bacterium]MCZ8328708.1 hypothetical protein [Cyclobacteriaceae bacterium]
MKKIMITCFALSLLVLGSACEDDPTVVRSKTLNILYFGEEEPFVGDDAIFEAPLFVLNDTRVWEWKASLNGTQILTGEGEYFEFVFEDAGEYTITLTEGDRSGTFTIEVIDEEFEEEL